MGIGEKGMTPNESRLNWYHRNRDAVNEARRAAYKHNNGDRLRLPYQSGPTEPALDVLDTIENADGPVTTRYVADDTGRRRVDTYRLLRRLCSSGLITRTKTRGIVHWRSSET